MILIPNRHNSRFEVAHRILNRSRLHPLFGRYNTLLIKLRYYNTGLNTNNERRSDTRVTEIPTNLISANILQRGIIKWANYRREVFDA